MLQLTPASVTYVHIQYHNHLVPVNLQPYGQQKIYLLMVPIQNRFHSYGLIFADFPEAIYLATNLRAIVILIVKLVQVHSAIVTPGVCLWFPR